jgi:hypothetical protein
MKKDKGWLILPMIALISRGLARTGTTPRSADV